MFKILSNKNVGPDIYHLVLSYEQLPQKPEPGQFFNIRLSGKSSSDPLLRRPFSLFDFDGADKKVEFVYRVVGRGTEILSKLEEGKELDVLGPLGNPFSIENREGLVHLIGGGMGIAPLYYLAKKLRSSIQNVFLGAANSKELKFFAAKFKGLGVETHLAAMEEKLEIKGSALVLWLNHLQQETPNFVYTCGPEKMLAAVEKECLKNRIGGELSVEKRMGCGIGVCLSCSCESREEDEKNKRACVEGPVFGLGEVVLGE